MTGFKFLGAMLVCAFLYGCGSGATDPTDNDEFFIPNDLDAVTGDPFDTERLMVVQIQMSDSEYKTLASEGRSLATGIRSCPSHDFEYTRFNARVSVDGEVIEDVSIRKKGYLGSLSPNKPSFKLDFDDAVEGRHFKGLKRMTLNNNRQDPTHARQCLSYKLYGEAGIKVPRCSLARVYVNGKDMGVYTHVESIKKPFLERVFGNDEGNLYEAQIADFGVHLNQKFEIKTNKTANNRTDLDEVAQALALDDEAFVTSIATLIDMEGFYTQWAMDSILGNWDSAMGNANNHYIYHNPTDDKFHYIPWGTDAAFTGGNIIKPKIGPLYRNNSIANRLFEIDATRAQFYARINELLTQLWDEDAFFDYIDEVQTLTGAPQDSVDKLKIFFSGSQSLNIASLPNRLANAMANNAADQINYALEDKEPFCEAIGTTNIRVNFQTNANTNTGIFDTGTFSFNLEDGTAITADMYYVSQGAVAVDSIQHSTDTSTSPATETFTMIGVNFADIFPVIKENPDIYVLQVAIESLDFSKQSIDLHGFANSLMLFKVIVDDQVELIASGKDGKITITQDGDGSNSNPIAGSISATLEYFKE